MAKSNFLPDRLLALTDEYLSYISFEDNDQKEVVQALRLYHIPMGEMEIIITGGGGETFRRKSGKIREANLMNPSMDIL